MTKFIEIPASKKSLSKRRPVFGVGINDADYKTEMVFGGVRVVCPIYRVWGSIIQRCYCVKHQEKNPTYAGCSISKSWLTFSNFHRWMVEQDFKGKQIDKDIVKTGNKLYSASTCIFVTRNINMLLVYRRRIGRASSIGVDFSEGRYRAHCNVDGKKVNLGTFSTDKDASLSYLAFKSKHVLKVAQKQDEPLKSYLTRISKEIASGEYFK